MAFTTQDRSPGAKLGLVILVAICLTVPLFSVWLLVYDREQQSQTAQTTIAQGWGGPQKIAGPLLVIPYRTRVSETVTEQNRPIVRTREEWRELTLAPEAVDLSTEVRPERRKRSIYEVVVYDAAVRGKARFAFPSDLGRFGVPVADMALGRAELRFGLTDPRGLGANPRIRVAGQLLRPQPGGGSGSTRGPGFFVWVDAGRLAAGALDVDFAYEFRGNGRLALAPQAGDTRWRVRSGWPHPSFQGGFLPAERRIGHDGFAATYRVGNLALGQSLLSSGTDSAAGAYRGGDGEDAAASTQDAEIALMQPVDLYSQVNRATKYGFLFIGFTFLAFLLFDVIGGVRVSAVEYLLVGCALILFFVLLLALAEVIGFAPAYLVASAAIIVLNTAYSSAVLKSWRRAGFVGGLLAGLYGILYVLLSLEAFSLLIGSMLLFLALAAVMYLTRGIEWGRSENDQAAAA